MADALLAMHRDATRNQAFDAARRVLKSAPDWGGSRSHKKQNASGLNGSATGSYLIVLNGSSLLLFLKKCHF